MSLGLAFVLRNVIQFVAGTRPRTLDVNTTDSISFLDLTIGRTELYVLITAVVVLLRGRLHPRARPRSAARCGRSPTTSTSPRRPGSTPAGWSLFTWVLAGGLAGLAGVLLVAASGGLSPNTGFYILLPLFAAVVLGGIGNAFGALAGGIVIGLTQEWSTLVISSRVEGRGQLHRPDPRAADQARRGSSARSGRSDGRARSRSRSRSTS